MPEKAKITDPTEGESKVLEDQASPGTGHNQLQRPEFLSFMARHAAIEKEQEKLRKAKNLMRREMKNQGIDCGLFDKVRKEMDLPPEVLAEQQQKLGQYRYFAGLAPNEQGDFLEAQEVAAKMSDEDRFASIRQDGYIASMTGRGATSDDNPYEPGTQEHEHWRDGWHDGQKELAAQLKKAGASI
jgi:ribosome modulation factor